MSLLIKDIQVIDGEGKPPFKTDVLIQKNIISAIGHLKGKEADKVIEGLDDYLTPGFIDINTDSDRYLDIFTNSNQNDFINQGVTTIIGGSCGISLAPLLYGTLESIGEWTDPYQINVNWHTVAEFLTTLEKLSLGVNFGTLVGHSTVRRAITGEVQRNLTDKELEIFKRVLDQAFEEGAFGLSTGLGYIHGRAASEKEIKELVMIVKKANAVYSTHIRNQTDKLLASVEETVRVANETGSKTIISHFRPTLGFESQFSESLEFIKTNSDVYFDIYPHNTSIKTIYTLLPLWAQTENLETMLAGLEKPDVVLNIEKELKSLNPENIRVANAPRHEYFIGKTLTQISADFELPPVKGLLQLMKITRLRSTVFEQDVNMEVLSRVLADKRAFIASNGNSPPPSKFLKHERSINTFPKFLEIVLQNNLMSLELAIKKITSAPAYYFNLKDRGVIKEGRVADLVILGKNDYKIKEVILGGKTAKGKILKHQGKT